MVFIKQETVEFQGWSEHREVEEVSADVVEQKGEVQGENWRKAESVPSPSKVLPFQVMTQRPVNAAAFSAIGGFQGDLLPLILPKTSQITGTCRNQT